MLRAVLRNDLKNLMVVQVVKNSVCRRNNEIACLDINDVIVSGFRLVLAQTLPTLSQDLSKTYAFLDFSPLPEHLTVVLGRKVCELVRNVEAVSLFFRAMIQIVRSVLAPSVYLKA